MPTAVPSGATQEVDPAQLRTNQREIRKCSASAPRHVSYKGMRSRRVLQHENIKLVTEAGPKAPVCPQLPCIWNVWRTQTWTDTDWWLSLGGRGLGGGVGVGEKQRVPEDVSRSSFWVDENFLKLIMLMAPRLGIC